MSNKETKEVLGLIKEQFPETVFVFAFSMVRRQWFLFCSEYDTYKSEDFSTVINTIREGLEVDFIAVCKKVVKKDDDFKLKIE